MLKTEAARVTCPHCSNVIYDGGLRIIGNIIIEVRGIGLSKLIILVPLTPFASNAHLIRYIDR